MDQVTVSVVDTAKLLGLSRSKIYELIHSGDLRIVKIGRRTLVSVASIRTLVSSREC